eukprot:5426807-Prymnesium_polylepis.1
MTGSSVSCDCIESASAALSSSSSVITAAVASSPGGAGGAPSDCSERAIACVAKIRELWLEKLKGRSWTCGSVSLTGQAFR